MKVKNMVSIRSGRPVANQFKILTDEGVYFQSYDSTICYCPYHKYGRPIFGKDWDYSVTTLKYLYQFLSEMGIKLPEARSGKAAIQRGIDTGLFRYDPDL